jgi:cell division protein FtsZ
MVHRIQNRNPGYSDFSNVGSAESFNFSTTMSNPITNGANALKLENEVISEQSQETSSSQIMSEKILSDTATQVENIVEDSLKNQHEQSFTEEALGAVDETEQVSNGLENFGIEEETPELFNSEGDTSAQEIESLDTEEKNSEEDDLEIPAFLRRQKN